MDKKKDKTDVKSITNTVKDKIKKCGKKLKRDLMKIEENFQVKK